MIIFCDKNKDLVKKVKKLIKDTNCSFARVSKFDDVFKEQEKNGGLICTASNPNFSMGGGLDLQIKKKFNIDLETEVNIW